MIMANEKSQSPLQVKMPTQGWKQFLTARTRMLAAYVIAKEQASNRQVKTKHGLVAEAQFRRWLSEFLPERYGVTSGFIISLVSLVPSTWCITM